MPVKDSGVSVAVIITTMNRLEYVRDAIASACEQTQESCEQTHESMRLVVIDDSDNRRTETVVDELRGAYSDVPITYLHNDTPQGPPAARNQEVAETDVRFLAFLDDDDPIKFARPTMQTVGKAKDRVNQRPERGSRSSST